MANWLLTETGGSGGGGGSNPQIPGGTIDGSNTAFTYNGTLNNLFLNGSFQTPNVDYTSAGGNISFTIAPPKGSVIYAT